MSAVEILEELPRLSQAELAQVQDLLNALVGSSRVGSPLPGGRAPRIRTPRLAQPELSRDFIKQVVESTVDAKL